MSASAFEGNTDLAFTCALFFGIAAVISGISLWVTIKTDKDNVKDSAAKVAATSLIVTGGMALLLTLFAYAGVRVNNNAPCYYPTAPSWPSPTRTTTKTYSR